MIDAKKITPEQWEIIEKYKAEAMANWCKDYPIEHAIKWAKAMYIKIGKPEPVVIVCDSPSQALGYSAYWTLYWKDKTEPEQFDEKWMIAENKKVDPVKAKDDYNKNHGGVSSLPFSIGQWWRAWSMWYRGAKEAYDKTGDKNLEFDTENLELFFQFNESCSTWVAHEKVIFVSRNPVICEIEDNQLHSTEGPAIKYRDGWEAYLITGVEVTKQIVMEPDTLTVKQIREEGNEEVRRIMLDQFGWDKFLLQTGAEVLDTQHHEWMETLMKCEDGYTVLCTYDPSTGRPYSLEVSEECTTCEQAQAYLAGYQDAFQGIDVDKNFAYPVFRT